MRKTSWSGSVKFCHLEPPPPLYLCGATKWRCTGQRRPAVRLLPLLEAETMSPAAASKRARLAEDVPWRASPDGSKPVPRIHLNPVLRIEQNPITRYALAVMKHPDPVGQGLAVEAKTEAAGPECIVPGLSKPLKMLGIKVWPIEISFGFLEPVGRELRALGKFLDSAINLMNASFQDR